MVNRHYVKLFSSIVHSTIWDEEPAISKLWITMLAIADQHGEVAIPIPGLARLARIDVATCESGLAKFQLPDKYSWTKDDEGRRIEEIDGGWRLLNYAKYRQMISESDKREKAAVRQKRYRDRHKTEVNSNASSNASNAPVTQGDAPSLQVEVEADVEVKVKGGETPPDLCASQYAAKLIEEIRMPHTPKNHQKVTAGIQSEITGGKSGASAYEFVLAHAIDAIERGEIVDGFYFEDAKWRRNGINGRFTPKQPENKRPDLTSEANPDCLECGGTGYKAFDRSECGCLRRLAQGGDRRQTSSTSLGYAGAAKAGT